MRRGNGLKEVNDISWQAWYESVSRYAPQWYEPGRNGARIGLDV